MRKEITRGKMSLLVDVDYDSLTYYKKIVCMFVWPLHITRVRISRVRLPILLVVS